MNERAPRFEPLRLAPLPVRVALALIGPLLWVIGLVVLAAVTHETGAIALGLAIATASFALATVVTLGWRRRRVREEGERRPEPGR